MAKSTALEIQSFTPTWYCQIVEVLTTQEKFLHGYGTLTDCDFTYFTTNVFDCFGGAVVKCELVKD